MPKDTKIRFIQLEPGAFLSDPEFQMMNAEERGVYCSLIFYLYCNGGELKMRSKQSYGTAIALLSGCFKTGNEWETLWDNVKSKFEITDGTLRHKRVTEELTKAEEFRQSKRNAGLKGAKARYSTAITQLKQCHNTPIANITKLNLTKGKEINNTDVGVVKDSLSEKLELDCSIVQAKKDFIQTMDEQLKPNPRSAKTLAKVVTHLVSVAEKDKSPAMLDKAAVWAMDAANSTVDNKIGLFIAKVKEQTNFNGAGKLLEGE